MAVLPIRPTPFFANKNQAFWNLQLAGWGGATMLRAMSALANGQPADRLVIILIATITGFSISLILAVVYSQLIKQKPIVTWGVTALVLGLATGVYAFIDSWVLDVAGGASTGNFASLFVGIYFIDLVLLGAWSALYYAINFFLQVEEQADRLERLEAQATSAQLAMLRYQLNPHFLFNTLNSISTLVLLKQTETANAMLTRLSSFLRHTLVTQPGGKVTVEQEVETLKLYLDIERMRFEERLRTTFRVDPEAAKACLPAMLLQPLVENAIKYAVSPLEEGAEISVIAQAVGPRLRVTVSDSGPGMAVDNVEDGLPAVRPSRARRDSTGVGLTNIRDRLAQAYGEEHRFEIRSPESGGFSVLIELPLESDEAPAALTAAPESAPQTAASPKPAGPSPVNSLQSPPKAPQTT
ncbi:sensor histidine kinase [Qipengyuania sp. 6B39]|uniref:sensor histidine kinase n=1 Tax=Qipengyuania proteolytica TaxID=2867239 RepID=UPI001C8A5D3A|nr:sensor histidine kinase [Qipengyuania proteolytica]MBX7494700.1 sensor histidine kinase [Qipengyuania proteolytica]